MTIFGKKRLHYTVYIMYAHIVWYVWLLLGLEVGLG